MGTSVIDERLAGKPRATQTERAPPASARSALSGAARIIRVLTRHRFLGAVRGKRHWPAPQEVREALEELGVVFLKFGQVIALRRDLLPDAYVEELERLHDRLSPVPFDVVRATVEHELGAPLSELFSSFDESSLAVATVAQVHAATLADGRRVVVKVRREGLGPRIAEDTATLTYLAAMAERLQPKLRGLDLVGMVRGFRDSLGRETDFRLEGQTIRRFRNALADADGVWIPDMIPSRTGAAVLTLEHSPGERVDLYAERHPEMKGALAERIATLVLHQVFGTGLFHADPHPGNLFVLPDGRICLHDFGMIGELDEPTREGLTAVLEAMVAGNASDLTDAYLELGLVGANVDRPALEADLAILLRQLHEQPLAKLSVGDALLSLLRVGTQHRVRNPGVILLLARAFLIAEALMRQLDPQMEVFEVFRKELARVALQRYSPTQLLARGRKITREMERFLQEAPADLRRALHRVADGELGRVAAPELETLGRRASRGVERLTGAVASAAFVIAGALLATIGGGHRNAGDIMLVVGVLGTLAVALGAWRRPRGEVGSN